ncbi:MAG: 3-deoxy-7-phosphoheptulonate synthase [Sphingomonas bacterium]|nr:3-deoxy-7-phosphoheptulonate synthase [Sphingomonas bacterium]
MSAAPPIVDSWRPAGWRGHVAAQQPDYADPAGLAQVEVELSRAAPVVSIEQCARLRSLAGLVANGHGLILQGGDCAETLGQDQAKAVEALAGLFDRLGSVIGEVVNIGRVAGQFAKPRSNPHETRGAVTLPAYRGDAINSSEFSASARAPDPRRMLAAHSQAVETATLLARIRAGKAPIFTSHEALLLPYEQALARRDEAGRWWGTSGHMLWVGDRSRQIGGAHVHFLSGIENLVGVKCGPTLGPDELLCLLDRLDPANRAGKIALVGRFGAHEIGKRLPPLMRAARRKGRRVLWMTDPMHGNSRIEGARKVRMFDDILAEARAFFAIAKAEGVHPAGFHLEMSPADVTECIGASGPDDAAGMAINFQSLCDPRLNAAQAEQLVRMVASLGPAEA